MGRCHFGGSLYKMAEFENDHFRKCITSKIWVLRKGVTSKIGNFENMLLRILDNFFFENSLHRKMTHFENGVLRKMVTLKSITSEMRDFKK